MQNAKVVLCSGNELFFNDHPKFGYVNTALMQAEDFVERNAGKFGMKVFSKDRGTWLLHKEIPLGGN